MSEGFIFYSNLMSKGLSMFILPEIIKLNIAEKLLDGPKSIEDLVQGTSLNPDRFHRFLQQLESSEIFSFDRDSRKWSNNHYSSFLTDPIVKPYLQLAISPMCTEAYLHYGELLYSDKDIFQLRGQAPYFEQIAKVPSLLAEFQEAMKAITKNNIGLVLEAINIDGCTSILDVGGGDGSLMVFLAERYSGLRGGVFERPEVATIARKNLEDNGVSERVRVCEGNFLEELPKGFDSILMKHIVHDWPDEICLRILKNCRETLEVGNKLFVIDAVVGGNREYYAKDTLFDLIVLGLICGKERTREEFELLMSQAGFRLEKVRAAAFESVIEAIAV